MISGEKNNKQQHQKVFAIESCFRSTRPGCSKLTTSLVNVVKISNVNISKKPIFFVEKMCEAFALQKPLSFFQQKISVYLAIKS